MESNSNDYQLKQGGKEYIFSTSIVGNLIKLSCKNQEGKIFSRNFTVNDLKSLDPMFNEITSESDGIDYIDKALNIHKVGVREEDGKIKIIFYVKTQGMSNQVEIPLGVSSDALSSAVGGLSSIPQTQTTEVTQNTLFENAPNIGPVTEDINTNNFTSSNEFTGKTTIQPAKSKVVTNPPKFLPVKILEPKYVDSGNQLNEILQSNQFNNPTFNLNQAQVENTNYIQTTTNTINTSNVINTANYDTTQYMQNTSANMDTQLFQNVQPTNDPNTFLSAPISGKAFSSTTHTLSQAQPIVRRPAEMTEGQNDIEPIIRGSLLSEYEVNNIKIIGDPRVIKKEPIQEIPGFNQEPITTAQFTTTTTTTSNIPDIINNTTNINNTNDYSQYFQQQPQIQNDFSTGATNFTQNYTENYTQNYQTVSQPQIQTDFGTTNYLQTQTTSNIASTVEGDMNNLQNFNSQNFGESNLTKTTYIPDNLDQNSLNLQSQNEFNMYGGDANTLSNVQQQMNTQLNSITGGINNYSNSQSEIDNLKAQNELYKKQLSELNSLRAQAAEVNNLRAQVAQLTPLKNQAQEMEDLKNQLIELNALKAKLQELNSVKSQLEELNYLRQQVGQMNILKQQLYELDSLRSRASDNEALQKKVEELEKLKSEYEQEIKVLKEEQRNSNISNVKRNYNTESNMSSAKKSAGMESKQITFEDKPEQVTVKGDIIQNSDELELITRKINKSNQKITLNLLYKATADSDKAAAFHSKCDDAKSSIVLVETDQGKRFGGFTTCSWSGQCVDKKDEDAFIFSLDKMKTYNNIAGEDAIGCYPKFGPIFLGCQIRIYDNAFSKGGSTFEKGLNYETEEDYELTGGDRAFNVSEIEVYEVIVE